MSLSDSFDKRFLLQAKKKKYGERAKYLTN